MSIFNQYEYFFIILSWKLRWNSFSITWSQELENVYLYGASTLIYLNISFLLFNLQKAVWTKGGHLEFGDHGDRDDRRRTTVSEWKPAQGKSHCSLELFHINTEPLNLNSTRKFFFAMATHNSYLLKPFTNRNV